VVQERGPLLRVAVFEPEIAVYVEEDSTDAIPSRWSIDVFQEPRCRLAAMLVVV
jgi:hypothetical protein